MTAVLRGSGLMFVRLVFILGGALFAVILAVLVIAAARPSDYHIERTVVMNAPPEKVYGLLEDVRRWQEWSLDEQKDPRLKRSYFGPGRGVGAGYDWTGGPESGQGRVTITEAEPPSRLMLEVHVREPYMDKRTVEIALQPHAAGTELRWAARGPLSYYSKVTTAFTTMDAVMGPSLEGNLARLKQLAES